MEPIFMGQLPELMKNYKDEETDILAGLEERLGEVFQKAQQMQKADRKGKICTMGISYLQSSVLTGNYELRIDLYDKEFYLDSAECCTYWNPAFITEYIQKDIKYFKYNIHGKVPQIRTYEIRNLWMAISSTTCIYWHSFWSRSCRKSSVKSDLPSGRSWMTVCM